jgi:hypothetical protein
MKEKRMKEYTTEELNAILGGRSFSLQFDEHKRPTITEVTTGINVSRDRFLVEKALRAWT